MSSNRPEWPADVVPGDDEGRGTGPRHSAETPYREPSEPAPSHSAPSHSAPSDSEPSDSMPSDSTTSSGAAASPRSRRRRKEKKKGSLLKELPILLVIAFVLALLVKTFLVQAFFIPSGSMEKTLHGCPGCTGDRVLVN